MPLWAKMDKGIAECLSTRHLIPLHCQIVYVCIYVSMSSGTRWCGAVWVVTPLSTFTLASVHEYFDRKWCAGAVRYGLLLIKYIHNMASTHACLDCRL